jgi:hypothetical protein
MMVLRGLAEASLLRIAFTALRASSGSKGTGLARPSPFCRIAAGLALGSHACVALSSNPARKSYQGCLSRASHTNVPDHEKARSAGSP